MNLTNFQQVLDFIQVQGYIVLLVLMIIEGPIVTTAAAFAASFGIFNIFIVFLLSIAGDLIGDIIYFEIGKKVRSHFIEKYSKRIGIENNTLKNIECMLHNNLMKAMVFIKFTPVLANIGLLLSGALRTPRRKFIVASFLITLPRAIFFTVVGYYFGLAINPILKYYNLTGYLFLVIIVCMLIFYIIYKWLIKKLGFSYTKKVCK